MNDFNTDTPERIAERNRKLLSEGRVPRCAVIGVAASPAKASAFQDAYRLARLPRAPHQS
jgi:hypothetical protein